MYLSKLLKGSFNTLFIAIAVPAIAILIETYIIRLGKFLTKSVFTGAIYFDYEIYTLVRVFLFIVILLKIIYCSYNRTLNMVIISVSIACYLITFSNVYGLISGIILTIIIWLVLYLESSYKEIIKGDRYV